MGFGDIGVIIGIMICVGFVIAMFVKMRFPVNEIQESYAEVLKTNHFWDPHYHENGIYITKELFSITFLVNNQKKSYYCSEELYYSAKNGDKVLIRYDRNHLTYLEVVQ